MVDDPVPEEEQPEHLDVDEDDEELRQHVQDVFKELSAVSKPFEALASARVDKSIIDTVTGFGGEFFRPTREIITDSSEPDARYQFMLNQLATKLAEVKEKVKRSARHALLDAVFDLSPDSFGDAANEEDDAVFTHLFCSLTGQTMAETLSKISNAQVDSLVVKWSAVSDAAYWITLADYYCLTPPKDEVAVVHFALMELTARLCPMKNTDAPVLWRNEAEIAFHVDTLIAASTLPPCRTLNGEVNVSEIYRCAARLNLPRPVVAELIRLALGTIAAIPKPHTVLPSLPEPISLIKALRPESSGESTRIQTDIDARNALRQTCVEMVAAANRSFNSSGSTVSAAGKGLATYVLRAQARAVRLDLVSMYDFYVSAVRSDFERSSDSSTAGLPFEYLARKQGGVRDTLRTWGTLYAEPVLDVPRLNFSLIAVKQAIEKMVVELVTSPQFSENLGPAERIIEPLQALAYEIGFQTQELLTGSTSTQEPLKGVLEFIRHVGLRGELRLGVQLAVKNTKFAAKSNCALSELVLNYCKKLPNTGNWVNDLSDALNLWRASASKSASDCVASTQALTTIFAKTQAAFSTMAPAERYKASSLLDTLIPTIAEYLQELAASSKDDVANQLSSCLKALSSTRPRIEAHADLAAYWRSKVGERTEPYKNCRFQLGDVLDQWADTLSKEGVETRDVIDMALTVTSAITEYMLWTRKKMSGTQQAAVILALETIWDNIEESLRVRIGH